MPPGLRRHTFFYHGQNAETGQPGGTQHGCFPGFGQGSLALLDKVRGIWYVLIAKQGKNPSFAGKKETGKNVPAKNPTLC
jgi:hypothetical protein